MGVLSNASKCCSAFRKLPSSTSAEICTRKERPPANSASADRRQPASTHSATASRHSSLAKLHNRAFITQHLTRSSPPARSLQTTGHPDKAGNGSPIAKTSTCKPRRSSAQLTIERQVSSFEELLVILPFPLSGSAFTLPGLQLNAEWCHDQSKLLDKTIPAHLAAKVIYLEMSRSLYEGLGFLEQERIVHVYSPLQFRLQSVF